MSSKYVLLQVFYECYCATSRLMASAFSDSLMASGGVETTPEILKTSIGMTMKIIPHVGTHMEAENKKNNISGLVCKLQTKIQIILVFWNATSRHANSSKLCNIVHPDVRNKSLIFQIDIPKIGYLTEQSIHASRMFFSVTEIERFGA